MPYQHVALLMCILYFLSEETKNNLTYYLGNRLLDRVLRKMVRDKLFPDWFGENFKEYSFSYSILSGLREAFAQAYDHLLIVHERSVVGMNIVLKMDDLICQKLLFDINIAEEDAKRWALILERLLIIERVEFKIILGWSKFHTILIEKNPFA